MSAGSNGSFISPLNSVMSAPAEKNLPVPVSTMALIAGIGIGLGEGLLQPHAQRMAQRIHRRIVHADDGDVALLVRFHDCHGCAPSFTQYGWFGRSPAWRGPYLKVTLPAQSIPGRIRQCCAG